jgi:hypothetical protein
MPALPARTTMSNPYPAPTDAAGRAWFLGLYDSVLGLLGSAATPASARDGLLLPKRAAKNLLVNPNFSVNQRGAGAGYFATGFVRDQWQANLATVTATGGTGRLNAIDAAGYIFQSRSLVSGVTYTLSNSGTAKLRIKRVDDLSFIPFTTGPQTFVATSSTIPYEFAVSDGTLGTVLLEEGAFATESEQRSDLDELRICQQYCYAFKGSVGSARTVGNLYAHNVLMPINFAGFPALESATFSSSAGSNGTPTIFIGAGSAASKQSAYIYNSAANWTVGSNIDLNAVFVPS